MTVMQLRLFNQYLSRHFNETRAVSLERAGTHATRSTRSICPNKKHMLFCGNFGSKDLSSIETLSCFTILTVKLIIFEFTKFKPHKRLIF